MSPNAQILDYIEAQKYLLGELTDEQTFDFECEVFPDEALSEQLDAARIELTEDYLRDELDGEQKTRFEKYFLSFPYNSEIFAFQRSLIREAGEPARGIKSEAAAADSDGKGFFAWLGELLSGKQFAIPAFAALVLLAVITGLYYTRSGPEIAVSVTPAPTVEKTPVATASPVPADNDQNSGQVNAADSPTPPNNSAANDRNTPPSPSPKNTVQPVTAPIFATIFLSGSTRSIGSREKPLIVGRETRGINLEFTLPAADPERPVTGYKPILETIGGEKVWEEGPAKADTSGEQKIGKRIPAGLLQTGQYRFRILGVFADGSAETLKSDTFFVKRIS